MCSGNVGGPLVDEHARDGAMLYTDNASVSGGTGREHKTIRHSARE